jgi:hypothetical protein
MHIYRQILGLAEISGAILLLFLDRTLVRAAALVTLGSLPTFAAFAHEINAK